MKSIVTIGKKDKEMENLEGTTERKKMKTRDKALLLTGAGIVAASLSAIVFTQSRKRRLEPLDVVKEVDLQKYQGEWFEIARLPLRYENDCFHVKANYAVNADGSLTVMNTCFEGSPSGTLKKSQGKAFVADQSSNAKLKVQFKWPFRGDYQIIALGPQYEYAMVGAPNRKNLWILSRTPELNLETTKELLNKARQQGFEVENLIFTPQ